ncbi:CotS family spore coat protein [Clostridium sp. BJN0001]|uniref:CotS family spore coat protein n=1 Tax=Clostridium sp. BJN0001 TaxID=2930219 RepID=UPI001FCF9EFE|nr:CotS family spore coat protein [Clostridium sp. BJN0001]
MDNAFLNSDIINNILKDYGIINSKISVIKFKNTDKQRIIYKISDEQKNKVYCLKKVYYGLPDLLYVYSACEWLNKNKFRVPVFIKQCNNRRFVNYNNMYFFLTEWFSGSKCSFDNFTHIIISSKTLAKIHKMSKNFSAIKGSSERNGFENVYISSLKHFSDLKKALSISKENAGLFSESYKKSYKINETLAMLSVKIASTINFNNLSSSLCHGDYVNKNILFPKDLNPCIIDFDKCKKDYCSKDLGYFMRRLLRRDKSLWDPLLAFETIIAYTDINILNSDDLKYLISYLAFPQKFWRITKNFYANKSDIEETRAAAYILEESFKAKKAIEFIVSIITLIKNEYNISIL